jgi:sugar phosphate isomerase/epimerase
MIKQTLGFLAVQPYFLLVGQPGGFKTAADFYKFAAQDCGFEGVTLPAGDPFIDIDKVNGGSTTYGDDFQAELKSYGLERGALRLEMHVVGQNVCLDPSRRLKFGHFITPDFRNKSHLEIEKMAANKMMEIIVASHKMGFRHIPGFCGGRGYAVGQAKWAAWPKHFALWVFALLASKWNPILEYAADRDQVITFEIGHPENDILTGKNFVLFWNMLTEKAQRAVGINTDGSHYVNVATNPIPHFTHAIKKTGCEITNHYKWGAVFDLFDGGASMYGGFDDWSKASNSFYTIGTVGDLDIVQGFHEINEAQHKRQIRKGGVDIIYEGECVGIQNPKQAMMVGAGNCRALVDGSEFTRLELFEEETGLWDTTPDRGYKKLRRPHLRKINKKIKLQPWGGGPFDAFADSPVSAPEQLSLTPEETRRCMNILAILPGAGGTLEVGWKYVKSLRKA